ncbi:MAG: PQQ-binding-like beta-propeller repeat protein, partial [Fervidobacterium sp.]|nr:PQQ-binding-like beta-propeller repeat protein [Fervidobacterium sp.]
RNGDILIGSYDKSLYCISSEGKLIWKFTSDGGIYSSPVIDKDGVVYFCTEEGTLYAVNFSGRKLWELQTGSNIYSTPVIGEDGVVYFANQYGDVYAVNSKGKQLWKLSIDSVRASLNLCNSLLIIVTENGMVNALKVSSKNVMKSDWPKFMKDIKNNGRF